MYSASDPPRSLQRSRRPHIRSPSPGQRPPEPNQVRQRVEEEKRCVRGNRPVGVGQVVGEVPLLKCLSAEGKLSDVPGELIGRSLVIDPEY